MAPAARPPTIGATGKPWCHRASAVVGLATAPIETVAPSASVARVFFITRSPFLRIYNVSASGIWQGFGRSTSHDHDCKSPARGRHWRSSTIGLSLSNAVVDKRHPGIDCCHGHLRLVLSVTDWTDRRFRSVATSRGEIHGRNAKPPGI